MCQAMTPGDGMIFNIRHVNSMVSEIKIMYVYLLIVLLRLNGYYCDHEVGDAELKFCSSNLTKNQLLVDVNWENSGCLLRCDTVDLAYPIGSEYRFPTIMNRLHLMKCGPQLYDRWMCFHGRCIELGPSVDIDKYWTPIPFPALRPINVSISDIEIRNCYRNLTDAQWLVHAELQNDDTNLKCEILDTSKSIGSSERRFNVSLTVDNSFSLDGI